MWLTMPRDRGPSAAMACVYLHFATALYNLWQEYICFRREASQFRGKGRDLPYDGLDVLVQKKLSVSELHCCCFYGVH